MISSNAAHGIQPDFYQHLGDLRAIYKIDEDMASAAHKNQHLSCSSYRKNAWQDFIAHQILSFGTTRFYLGGGNHEVILPKSIFASPPNTHTCVAAGPVPRFVTTAYFLIRGVRKW